MSREEFNQLKKRIRAYVDLHPYDRQDMARDVGGVDRWGGITEEFLVACSDVMTDLFERHLNN